MMRRIWRQQSDGSLVEVTGESRQVRRGDFALWNDRMYQDAGDPRFSSRTEHREYLRARGLTTMDDFAGSWDRAGKDRDAFYTSAPDQSRAGDVARAIEMLQSGHRPRREEEL